MPRFACFAYCPLFALTGFQFSPYDPRLTKQPKPQTSDFSALIIDSTKRNLYMALPIQNHPVAHLVGIAGSGMRALATVLMQRGWTVTGSDLQPSAARKLVASGAKIAAVHAEEYLPSGATLLIYSEAIPAENSERKRADQLGIPTFSYAQMLGQISTSAAAEVASGEAARTLAIAGTHGKSTVTAMAAQILIRAALDPTVICGEAEVTPSRGGIGSDRRPQRKRAAQLDRGLRISR